MAGQKTIVVVGATGAQGGGLARAILDNPDGPFRLRALTRKPGSARARELAGRGADVVQADLDDQNSLAKAFSGAWGAYCVTNYWEHMDPEKETTQGKHLAAAAAEAGLQHAIWSTFEDTRERVPLDDDRMPTLMGKYKVPHFDAKAMANHFFTDAGVPTTFLLTSFYWDNMIHFGTGPQRGPDGVLTLTMPMGEGKLPGIAAGDIGGCAYGIFGKRDHYVGKTVGIAGEQLTGAAMAAGLTEVLGEEVRYNAIPADVYRGFGFPGADDMGNMFQYKRDFNEEYCRVRSVEESRELNPRLQTYRDWLSRHAKQIPLG